MLDSSPRRHGDRRDRHERGRRAVADPRRRPLDGYRTRDRHRFARMVTDAAALLPPPLLEVLAGFDLVVLDVPPPGAEFALCELRMGGTPPSLGVFRRPLEARATSKPELIGLIGEALAVELATHLGWSDDDLDALGWDGPLR